MTVEGGRRLVPADLGPGLVPIGMAERILERARDIDDPELLWDGATSAAAYAQKWNGTSRERAELKSLQMFLEVLLGQTLGPNPGAGGDHKSDGFRSNAHAHLIPSSIVRDLRRLFGWADSLVEAVRNGARSRRSLLLLVDEWEAGERPEPSVNDLEILHGDFRDVLADIKSGSVALVLTDPPYPAEYLPLWDDLGAWSAEHLVEGGSLVAYSGQSHLPEVFDRLRPHLRYWWTIMLKHRQTQMIPGKWVSATWKPLVWFVRERRGTQTMLIDAVQGGTARKNVPTGDDGSWAQGVEELAPIISALTAPGDLIVDPFAGSGTVGLAAHRYGRRFIGAEIGA